MPALLFVGLAIAGVFLLMNTKRAIAWVRGVEIEIELGDIGNGLYLRKDAAQAFNAMAREAAKVGLKILVSGPRSAFRTSEMQAALVSELGLFSAGGLAAAINKSPHQTGIAIDLTGTDPENLATFNPGLRAWLLSNGPRFHWYNVGAFYNSKKEFWHWEYRPEGFIS